MKEKKKTTDEEIKGVMIEEKSRGNGKIDRDTEKLKKQFEHALYELLQEGDAKKFKSLLPLQKRKASRTVRR